MKAPTAVSSPAELDQLCINTIRTLSMDAVQKANSGHPGTAMALAPLAYALWTRHMRYNPANPQWPNRDRFVLSAGHACILQYTMLYLTGYDVSLDDLKSFRQWGSKTPGHPEYGHTPGIEATTGPLGQGFGNAVGMALAERMLAARFNKSPGAAVPVNHFTYVICSDGDLMEGVASEAASLAGHLQLGRIIAVYDDNRITLDGPSALSFNEDVCARFNAYGWHTCAVEDANDLDAIDAALNAAKGDPRPSLIRLRSHIGYGAPHKQDTNAAHGEPLGADEIKLAKKFYGWPEDAQFLVPDEALAQFRKALERGAQYETEWRKEFDAYAGADPELGRTFTAQIAGELPKGWSDGLPTFKPEDGPMATRDASNKALNAIAAKMPALVGGAADLATSNKTDIKDGGSIEAGSFGDRILHFGVREHAMAAALNGMTLHRGFRAFGATFLIFSDYMRPSIRLAALSRINPIYVWTHDSIGLGEDGPTHQSIEQLASLRAIPNMTVLRPADANETAICWRLAVEHTEGPVGIVCTRQKIPVYAAESVRGAERGGYVLSREASDDPAVILIGTGSEVQWCVGAQKILKDKGVHARVVSLPCFSLFDAQDQAYRDSVLPPSVTARVAIEAAAPFGWERYVGMKGTIIGMRRFGASAPADTLFKEFGFTSEHVADAAEKAIEQSKTVTDLYRQ
ncbi:MAG TPA: transketolase [Candidatus Eremiobacteraceae bacterium]|nr:transketolase [Candidatus Eremiobacteraceae bacterium]